MFESISLAAVLSSAAVLSLIVAFFAWVEKNVLASTKEDVAIWLGSLREGGPHNTWPVTFAQIFDRIFGENYRSAKFIIRSVCCSMLVFCLIFSIWAFLDVERFQSEIFDESGPLMNLIVLLSNVVIINLLPDYISLVKSRAIIRAMSSKRGYVSLLLIADTLCSALLAFVELYLAFFLPSLGVTMEHSALDHTLAALRNGEWMSIFFYTTFFTSIWAWGYAFSGFVVRRFITPISSIWDVDKHPIVLLGLVADILLVLGVAICAFAYYFVSLIPEGAFQ